MADLGSTTVLGNLTVSLKTKTADLEVTKSITTSGNIVRLSHSSGYLVGSYNSVGANDSKTNPIYTMGSNYMPTDSALGAMYGIGFSHENLWGIGKSTGWGLYTVENGDINNTISSSGIWTKGTLTTNSLINTKGGLQQNGVTILNGTDTWLRTTGDTGWYSTTYGGGIYMTDSTWVRVYNNKNFVTLGEIRTNDGFSNALGKIGTNAANAKNHFHQTNAGSAVMSTGWISAAFGDTTADRTVIGQVSGKAILGAHNGALTKWANLHLNTDGGNVVVGLPTVTADTRSEKFQVFGNSYFNSDVNVSGSIFYPIISGTTFKTLLQAQMSDNDYFRIAVGGTASSSGFVELATADDGTEPIYVRQYTGVFTTLTRTATLLDASGNTSFPGTLTVTGTIIGGSLVVSNTSSTNGYGISLYGNISSSIANGMYQYGLSFAGTSTFGTHGAVTGDWATYFTMSSDANRGWIFRNTSTPTNVASISNTGAATFNSTVTAGGGFYSSTKLMLYSNLWGGGFEMQDSVWIRTYGTKSFYCNQTIKSEISLETDGNLAVTGSASVGTSFASGGSGSFGGALTVTGATTLNSTLGVTGLITGSASLTITGTIYASGNITAYSDSRLKEVISIIESPIEKLQKLTGYVYKRKDLGFKTEIGLLAQDVESVMPELITELKIDPTLLIPDGIVKTLDYSKLTAFLIEVCKEQQKRIEELEKKVM